MSTRGRIRRLAARHPAGAAGAALLAAIALACLVGPALWPPGAREVDPAARDRGPSAAHPFGTAELGEDVLARVLEGGRASLAIGLGTALLATLAGAALGLLAGWRGGRVDALLSRLTELVLIVPAFVVLIVVSLAVGRMGVWQAILALALLSWPPLFRLARASALRTRELPYVEAARAAGAGGGRIVARHLLPAAAPEVASFAAIAVAVAILAESALSFLGLGIDPERTLTWGNLMTDAQDTIEDRPWLTLFPGAFVVATALGASLVADAVRAALAPDAPTRRRPSRRWAP